MVCQTDASNLQYLSSTMTTGSTTSVVPGKRMTSLSLGYAENGAMSTPIASMLNKVGVPFWLPRNIGLFSIFFKSFVVELMAHQVNTWPCMG